MKTVFMGTPEFAACSLRAMLREGMDISAVFTQPDKPKNRGHKLTPGPVKTLALEHNLPVYQPATFRDGEAVSILKALQPDIIVVVAYGRILPADVLALPRYGCVNVHGSLLPRWRGAAPIQRAVLHGDRETGVTTMYLSEGMDEGDMIFSESTPIRPGETSEELFARLAPLGAELLIKTLRAIEDGTAPRAPQDAALATYAAPLTKDMAPVDWSRSAAELVCHIAGLQPWPCATAELGGAVCKLFRAEAPEHNTSAAPGTVLRAGKDGIEIACGEGTLRLLELQPAGKGRMTAAAFALGRKLV